MMEVKQNTAVDLNNLMGATSSTNVDIDTVDSAAAVLKNNGSALNGLKTALTNGSSKLVTSMNVDDDLEAMAEHMPSDLEDVLLAGDDDASTSNVVDELLADVVPKALDEEKVETSSTASSDKLRDLGDDLDTLLSKINDIVEDCNEEEPMQSEEQAAEVEGKTAEKNEVADNAEKMVIDAAVNVEAQPAAAETVANDAEEQQADTAVEDNEVEAVGKKLAEENEAEMPNDKADEDEKLKEQATEEKTADAEDAADGVNDPDTTSRVAEVPCSTELAKTAEAENKVENSVTEETTMEETNLLTAEKSETAQIAAEKSETAEEHVESVETAEEQDKIAEAKSEKTTTADSDDDDEVTPIESEIPSITVDDDDDEMEVKKATEETAATYDKKQSNENDKNKAASVEKIEDKQNAATEESDDEIVFYVDSKSEQGEETNDSHKASDDEPKPSTEAEAQAAEKSKPTAAEDEDDDVVLLDDDDDDEDIKNAEASKAEEKTSAATADDKDKLAAEAQVKKADESNSIADEAASAVKELASSKTEEVSLLSDNSDNARDDFVAHNDEPKKLVTSSSSSTTEANKTEAKASKAELEESTSNCSSSSNLLLEAKSASEDGQAAEEDANEDAEMDEDEEVEADDVEIIEDAVANELRSEETSKDQHDIDEANKEAAAPPAKRMRLSQDEPAQVAAAEESNASDSQTAAVAQNDVNKTDSSEAAVTQTEDVASAGIKRSRETLEHSSATEPATAATDAITCNKKAKLEQEEGKEQAQEQLSKVESSSTDIKEEAQNFVEYKPKVEASDIPVPLYPPPKFDTKIEPFSVDFYKRFRKSCSKLTKSNLEELVLQKVVEAIVHKSEFAEMREIIEKQEKIIASHRNRITELSKQFKDLEMVHTRVLKDIEHKNSQFIMPVKITRAVGLQVYIPNKKSGAADSQNQAAATPAPAKIQSSPQRVPPLSSPIRAAVADSSSSSTTVRQNASAASAAAATAARRGCVQKITPQRPMESSSNSASYRVQQSSAAAQLAAIGPTQSQQVNRILNKAGSSVTVTTQRKSYPSQNPSSSQQQNLRQQQQPSNVTIRYQPNTNHTPSGNKALPLASSQPQQQYRSSASATQNNFMTSLPSGSAVSITPAKPKEKAVIDLTDEDDIAQQQAQQSSAAIKQRQRQLAATKAANNYVSQQQQRATSNAASRLPQNAAANAGKGVMRVGNGNSSSNISNIYTPPGTSITRVHVGGTNANNSGANRIKYGHPAPLPTAPSQPYNAAWKLPPPRPTIRISNLDNGIVISWTMEEAMDRHADCTSYQIYAYQETTGPPMVDSWRHVGDVKAMLLPMAVTLTQFQEGQRYYFAVRAVDVHQRFGPFSLPKTWS